MTNNHIDYIELTAPDLEAVKTFYSRCFGWRFTDYGPDYTAFENSGVAGGFRRAGQPAPHGVLVVLYHDDLEAIQGGVETAGGRIVAPIFTFPGGRRFHFEDPAGNQLAVWSDT